MAAGHSTDTINRKVAKSHISSTKKKNLQREILFKLSTMSVMCNKINHQHQKVWYLRYKLGGNTFIIKTRQTKYDYVTHYS